MLNLGRQGVWLLWVRIVASHLVLFICGTLWLFWDWMTSVEGLLIMEII